MRPLLLVLMLASGLAQADVARLYCRPDQGEVLRAGVSSPVSKYVTSLAIGDVIHVASGAKAVVWDRTSGERWTFAGPAGFKWNGKRVWTLEGRNPTYVKQETKAFDGIVPSESSGPVAGFAVRSLGQCKLFPIGRLTAAPKGLRLDPAPALGGVATWLVDGVEVVRPKVAAGATSLGLAVQILPGRLYEVELRGEDDVPLGATAFWIEDAERRKRLSAALKEVDRFPHADDSDKAFAALARAELYEALGDFGLAAKALEGAGSSSDVLDRLSRDRYLAGLISTP